MPVPLETDAERLQGIFTSIDAYGDVLHNGLVELLKQGDSVRFTSFVNIMNEVTTFVQMLLPTGNWHTVPEFPASMNWEKQFSEHLYYLRRYLNQLSFYGIPSDAIADILEFEINMALHYV